MIAQTDDAALRLKDVWKGNDSFAIPFDARYGAWAAGVVLSTVGTIAAFRITTAFRSGGAAGGALLAFIVLGACTATAITLRGATCSPTRATWATFLVVPFLLVTLGPTATGGGPPGALLALTAAVVVGVGGSVVLIRSVGRHVDAVTPLRYQVAVFRAESNAPRPVPPVARLVAGPVQIETVNLVAHDVTGPRPL